MKYVVGVSKSRAKRKRRQRARPAGAPPPVRALAAKQATDAKARGGGKGAGADGPKGGVARRPDPIWAPFPLTEVGMGAGIVIFGIGYGTSNTWLVSIGALVLAVVVAELCLREHFAGFRSHALLLAALTVVAAHSLVFAIDDGYGGPVALAVDLAIGGALAWWLRRRFRVAREGQSTA